MTPVKHVLGPAVALALASIDTDQLIPARFMSRPRSQGYGHFLLHDLRRNGDGQLNADWPLNRIQDARVLVARRNFGSGSSREAAVYALVDAGFGAVIAPSFGDIFQSNCVKNGLVPVRLEDGEVETLISHLEMEAGAIIGIDLDQQTVRAAGHVFHFSLDPVWREQLMNGWDDVDVTKSFSAEVEAFRARDTTRRPWARPA
jgi:3-isopropylmalate/(R)-2-methylmalate dehydratase small subunit